MFSGSECGRERYLDLGVGGGGGVCCCKKKFYAQNFLSFSLLVPYMNYFRSKCCIYYLMCNNVLSSDFNDYVKCNQMLNTVLYIRIHDPKRNAVTENCLNVFNLIISL